LSQPELVADTFCFACGKDNPCGLHMAFTDEGEDYVSRWTPRPEHQGWHKILHGGLISTLLDEVMTWRLVSRGLYAMTAEMTVRLKAPTPLDQELTIRARVVNQRRRFYEVEGEITLPDGTVTATATGKYMMLAEGLDPAAIQPLAP
jgi:acyl-coenzyme A thioesterase PaaI-like protein